MKGLTVLVTELTKALSVCVAFCRNRKHSFKIILKITIKVQCIEQLMFFYGTSIFHEKLLTKIISFRMPHVENVVFCPELLARSVFFRDI